jgi:hypothetical protein
MVIKNKNAEGRMTLAKLAGHLEFELTDCASAIDPISEEGNKNN